MRKLIGKKAAIIFAEQRFQDKELLGAKRILEDEGVDVTLVSTTLDIAEGKLGTKIKPEKLLSELKVDEYDAIIFVGGGGAVQYWRDPTAHKIAQEAVKKNKALGAICITPVILARAGLLVNKEVAAWPAVKAELEARGAIYTEESVKVVNKIVTGKDPEAVEEFSKSLLKVMTKRSEEECGRPFA